MTQRERVMAFGVGALALLVGGYFALSTGFGHYQARQDALDAKVQALVQAEQELMQAKQKKRMVENQYARALPGDRSEAGNEYKQWLQRTLRESYVFPESVHVTDTFIEPGKAYGKLKFDIRASARLDDLTNWLCHFQATNCLHRIKHLKLTPLENSRLLSIVMEIETISLAGVSAPQTFAERKLPGKTAEETKAHFAAERERLMNSIAGRNAFGPPNHEPSIDAIGKINATTGKQIEVIVKGKDKRDGTNETDDQALLLYRLADAEMLATDYSFDETKGILRWTPKKKGEYKATVEVLDDGIPRKMTRQTFTINVKDPEKVVDVPKTAPKPAFDIAKWAFVTAIVQEEGTGEVWINERSSGKSQKLKLGDEVKYGTVTGKVSRIDSTGVEVETKDAKFFTKVGQSLGVAASQAGGS